MKNLVCTFMFLVLWACVEQKNVTTLKKDIKSSFDILQKASEKEFRKYTIMQIQNAKQINKSKETASRVIESMIEIEQKYFETLKSLDKINSNQTYKAIYKNHIKYLDKKVAKEGLGINFFEDKTALNTFLLSLGSESLKEKLKLSIYHDFSQVLAKSTIEDLHSIHCCPKMILWGKPNIKTEIGNILTLNTFLTSGLLRLKDKYNYNIMIDKGKIKKDYSIFNIAIPTQKIGKEEFEVVFKLKDWVTNQDTTLYFRESFEVTK